MRTTHRLSVAIVGALVLGTAAQAALLTGNQKVLGELREGQALVYVVRVGQFAGSARTENVFLNDRLVGIMKNNSYNFFHAKPGTYLFWGSLHNEVQPLFLDLVAGQTYYIVFKLSQPFSRVAEEQGKAAVEQAKNYRAITGEEQVDGDKEGAEGWPRYQSKYDDQLAVRVDEATYTPPPSTEGLAHVPATTPVTIELMENLSSGSSKVGDAVWVRAADDVTVNGTLFINKGGPVLVRVRDVLERSGAGVGGRLDLVVLAVTAADGTRCPLIGQILERGANTSVVKSVGFWAAGGGLLGQVFAKGRRAFRLVGERVTVYTREDVWVRPLGPTTAVPPAERSAATRASVAKPVACKLVEGRGPESVDLVVDTRDDIASAALVQVDGADLPAPVEASRVARSAVGLAASFGGWNLCRYLKPPPVDVRSEGEPGPATTLTLRLITRAGDAVYADATVRMTPQEWK